MIYCANKIYAKVWKIKKEEKYLDLQVTTSEKNQDGEYINSGWFPRVIGHAFNSLKDSLKEGDRIIITKSKFTNERYTAKDGSIKSAFKFIILDAELETPKIDAESIFAEESGESEEQQDDCPW